MLKVNIEEIKNLYKELSLSIKDSLDVQDASNALTSEDYAAVLTRLLGANLELAVKTAQQQPLLDAQVAAEEAKLISISKDNLLKDAQIALENQKVASMQLGDGIKREESTKDMALKDAQISKIGKEVILLTTQEDEAKKTGITKRRIDTDTADSIESQTREAKLNGIATRSVKAQDEIVKTNQAILLTRQTKALDDSVLKDILKEASGGYAMIYDTKGANAKLPATWTNMDEIALNLLSNAGSNVNYKAVNVK